MSLLRNSLFFIGFLAIFAGVCIGAFLVLQPGTLHQRAAATANPAILVATRAVQPGDLMREGDLAWRVIGTSSPPADAVVRGQVSELAFDGAVSRRAFAAGQPISASAFIGPTDRRFLAAVLAPGDRAVTITVSPSQSASGLILPDDRVDVILVRDIGASAGSAAATNSVAKTLLSDVRVVALGQTFERAQGAAAVQPRNGGASASGFGANAQLGTLPATLTLEMTETDAQRLFASLEVGKVELALRSLARSPNEDAGSAPISAADANARSAAASDAAGEHPTTLGQAVRHRTRPGGTGSTEPIHILRGSAAPSS